ncbi:hypothetical protein [Guptibacillus hwajinpoensis]|nr:hypothetical protein [Alkalihalobacillus macyae]
MTYNHVVAKLFARVKTKPSEKRYYYWSNLWNDLNTTTGIETN